MNELKRAKFLETSLDFHGLLKTAGSTVGAVKTRTMQFVA